MNVLRKARWVEEMLTSGERMLAAMTDGFSKDYPVVIPYIDIFIRDHWDEITDKPWWVQNVWDVDARLEVEKSFQEKVGIDWVETGFCPSRDWRKTHKVKALRGQFFLVDTGSNAMEEISRPPPGGFVISSYNSREPLIKTMEDIDIQIKITRAEELIENGSLDYIEAIVDEYKSEKFIVSSIGSPFSQIYPYFGVKKAMLNLFEKPKLIKHLLDKLVTRDLEYLRAYAKMGVDGIWVEECLTSADIMSPALFEQFVLPYVKTMISEIRRLGMKSIYYPCGDVRDRLELMIEAGPDCISLEESKKDFEIDIAWVDKVVAGRACIFGNLDAVWLLRNGTRFELEKEIKRQINVGRNHGKFVMSLGSPITAETPLSRVKEYVDITRQIANL